MTPSPELTRRVAHVLGADPVTWTPVHGGYTPAARWVVQRATGQSVFVKVGTTPNTSARLRTEYDFYSRMQGDFLPALLGWADGEEPILVLEDLSRAVWPPPWSEERVAQVRAALAAIAATPPPPGIPLIAARHGDLRSWGTVAADPAPFLSLGLCSAAWLDVALPALRAADAAAILDGEHLLHLDVRSDNLCFVGERAVLVDWDLACRGNPLVDVAAWLPSLAAEGGPDPLTILPDEPELAAVMAGFFAARAGLPHPVGAPRVRGVQLAQLRVALPWAVASLGLPPPV